MFTIKLWTEFPVHNTEFKQARVFINNSANFKASAPIWKIITDMAKTTHRYTFTSTSWNNTMYSWHLTKLKNKVLDSYISYIHKQNASKIDEVISPLNSDTPQSLDELSDEELCETWIYSAEQYEAENKRLKWNTKSKTFIATLDWEPVEVTSAPDGTLCLA